MKKLIGIISIILFAFVGSQSCITGLTNAFSDGKELGGNAGIILSLCLLIAGILLYFSKHSMVMLIASLLFYAIGGIIGIKNYGKFNDLKIWSIVSLFFAALLLYHFIRHKREYIQRDGY